MWKRWDYSETNVWSLIHSPRHRKKTNGIKNKSGLISRQGLSQERGPVLPFTQSTLHPWHSMPWIRVIVWLSCKHWLHCDSAGTQPHMYCFPPAWGSFGFIPLSCDSGTQPAGPPTRVVPEDLRWFIAQLCQVNHFAIPWEMSSQGQSRGAPWVNSGLG